MAVMVPALIQHGCQMVVNIVVWGLGAFLAELPLWMLVDLYLISDPDSTYSFGCCDAIPPGPLFFHSLQVQESCECLPVWFLSIVIYRFKEGLRGRLNLATWCCWWRGWRGGLEVLSLLFKMLCEKRGELVCLLFLQLCELLLQWHLLLSLLQLKPLFQVGVDHDCGYSGFEWVQDECVVSRGLLFRGNVTWIRTGCYISGPAWYKVEATPTRTFHEII